MNNTQQPKKDWKTCRKGFLLISSYMVLTTLMIASLAMWSRSIFFWNNIEREQLQTQAFHLAESGIDDLIVQLETNPATTSVSNIPYIENGQTIGSYSVTVESPSQQNPLIKRLTATGTTPDLDGNGRGVTSRTVVTVVELIPRKVFDFAIFAEKNIDLAGSPSLVIDSYNSKNGVYGGSNSASNADVSTNSTGSSTVTLSGNANVHGDITVGPSGDPSDVVTIGPNASVSGGLGAAFEPKVYPEPEVPKSAVPLGAVVLDANKTYTYDGGTYVMDSLSITGKAKMDFTGPATIYLTGDAYIAGNGIATFENRPKNVIIQVVGQRTIEVAGNGSFFGALYAPKSHVDISGNGTIYGAMVADTYAESGNGTFHYDEDLKVLDSDDKYMAIIKSWQENGKVLS